MKALAVLAVAGAVVTTLSLSGAAMPRTLGTSADATSVPSAKAASTPAGIRRVSFYSPSRNLSCVMLDGSRTSSFRNGVNCQSVALPHAVSMGLDGQLKICHGLTACVYPHPGVSDIPKMVLGYGKQITVGRFRCLSQRSGVTCTVIQSGKGFLINSAGITRVGP